MHAEPKFEAKVESTSSRNPSWTAEELILALDFYFRLPPWTISGKHPELIALSDDLGRLAAHTGPPDTIRYRNPNGTYMKLMNFQSLDSSRGGRGLKGAGARDREIWTEYSRNLSRLSKVAGAIRATMASAEISGAEAAALPDVGDITEASEGALLTRIHRVRERNRKLITQKKAIAHRRDGALKCEACTFDF